MFSSILYFISVDRNVKIIINKMKSFFSFNTIITNILRKYLSELNLKLNLDMNYTVFIALLQTYVFAIYIINEQGTLINEFSLFSIFRLHLRT